MRLLTRFYGIEFFKSLINVKIWSETREGKVRGPSHLKSCVSKRKLCFSVILNFSMDSRSQYQSRGFCP